MRLATYEHLIAAEDAADHALGTAARGRAAWTSTSTACTRCWLADEGQVVAVKPGEGGGHRRRGTSARRGTRWPRCSGGGPRRTTRRCAPTRPPGRDRRGRRRGRRRRRRRRRRRAASIHDIVMVKEAGPRGAAVLRRPRAALGAGPVPRAGHDARGGRDGRCEAELGDLRDGEFAVDHLAPGQVSLSRDGHGRGPAGHGRARRSGSSAAGWTRARHRARAPPPRATRPIDDPAGPRAVASTCWAAAATRRPGTTSAATGRPTTGAAQADGRRGDRLRQRLGRRRGRGHARAGGRRVVEPDRDRLELGVRASSASTRAAACCSRGRCGSRPGETRRFAVRQAVSVARDRAAEEARRPREPTSPGTGR